VKSVSLSKVARDSSGWDSLYVDPSDNRFWELTYPESASHGGGPPHLKCLSRMEVREKYGDDPLTGGGRTIGGAREFVILNGPVPSNAVIRVVGP